MLCSSLVLFTMNFQHQLMKLLREKKYSGWAKRDDLGWVCRERCEPKPSLTRYKNFVVRQTDQHTSANSEWFAILFFFFLLFVRFCVSFRSVTRFDNTLPAFLGSFTHTLCVIWFEASKIEELYFSFGILCFFFLLSFHTICCSLSYILVGHSFDTKLFGY